MPGPRPHLTPATPGGRLRAALAAAADDAAFARAGRPCAIGWATVELDRAASELAADLGLSPGSFAPAADSHALGARCRVAPDALPGGVALAILEPATEGFLAAFLARHDEGPAAIWSSAVAAAPAPLHGTSPGPFGPERALAEGPRGGPRWLLVEAGPGTIPI